ncbi:Ultraviolet-B receptor UVR8 [Psilocybe cubensis]|uniref:Ultraviolet-B receptor UVR8 n=2 Tax=Psilocybe cubensis TaxID=181762 RepID=A0ACB8GWL6_PSICU|nr:Ultraviolet-B receptor UVR8 [Psilocybe cubensis]KAH9479864.1 Ultraviolet-B receptor UVR8 [Psilocybe cubensis]
MKFNILRLALFSVCVDVVFSASSFEARSAQTCGDPSVASTFYKGFNYIANVHTFNTQAQFVNAQVLGTGWQSTIPSFRAWTSAGQLGTAPLFYDPTVNDVVFSLTSSPGWAIVGYVYPTQICSSVPLYAAARTSPSGHWYTTIEREHNELIALGWVDQGIVAYVLPIQDSSVHNGLDWGIEPLPLAHVTVEGKHDNHFTISVTLGGERVYIKPSAWVLSQSQSLQRKCAMLSLFSSGSNAQGQLGHGNIDDAHTLQPCTFSGSTRGSLPSGTSRVLNVASGANHTLVLLERHDGCRELWGCGDGRKGQLGPGFRNSKSFERIQLVLEDGGLEGYTLKFVEATWETSYAVLSSAGHPDVIVSFGSDDYGDLGVGGVDKDAGKAFHIVSLAHLIPSAEMEVLSITTGQRHVIVQVRATSLLLLVGWGLSRHGQLGVPTGSSFVSTPRVVADVSGAVFVSCSLGIHHTLILRQSKVLSCLGSDRKGQFEVAKRNISDVQSIHCTWNGSYIVVIDDGTWVIRSSGSNSRSQLGWIPHEDDAGGIVKFPDNVDHRQSSVSLACGSEHVLAVISYPGFHPELWGWGWNEHGNLGLGHTVDVPLPVKIDAPGMTSICGVWAGSGTSWVCGQIEADG